MYLLDKSVYKEKRDKLQSLAKETDKVQVIFVVSLEHGV